MKRYVAFLRAINVGGHVVKMDELKALFSSAGMKNVESFIASGNIIFDTKSAPDEKLEQKLEAHLEKALGYEVGVFVRSVEEIKAISEYKPFPKEGVVLSVGFLHKTVAADIAEPYKTEVDEFHVHAREIYWLCQVRTSDSKFPAKKFEKVTGPSTWRNMNTVVRLAAKYKPLTIYPQWI